VSRFPVLVIDHYVVLLVRCWCLLLLYYHAGLVDFIDLHQVLVPLHYDLLDLHLLLGLIRGMRELLETLLTNENGGTLIEAFLELILMVVLNTREVLTSSTLSLKVVLKMLLKACCIIQLEGIKRKVFTFALYLPMASLRDL
jgi:hypothetical protein